MKALILGAGGARGAYEAGVAISLLRSEDFEIVCGASIGAVNGALIAQGDLVELERIWRTIASLGVIRLAPEVAEVAKRSPPPATSRICSAHFRRCQSPKSSSPV